MVTLKPEEEHKTATATVATPLPASPPTGASSAAAAAYTVSRLRHNGLIHSLYTRHQWTECVELINRALAESNGQCEFALLMRGIISRQFGQIAQSLSTFQLTTLLSPHNTTNLKQVAKSLYLLGKHRACIDVYTECERIGMDGDWELHHWKGVALTVIKQYVPAIDALNKANGIEKHDQTYAAIGKVYALLEQYEKAIDTLVESLEHSPDNAETLTTIGLLYLRLGQNYRAFDYLGNSLNIDPKNPKTILAAGSIIQDHSDMDVALSKYRIAAVSTPNSAQLWNNIGMCFFGKQRYIAAIACLKRALSIDPFEWIISYNIGLLHLNTKQYASAFHYLSTAINLKPDFAASYMYLAMALAQLDDLDNAISAYDKACAMESDHLILLNFCITLWNGGRKERAVEVYTKCRAVWNEMDDEGKKADKTVFDMMNLLIQQVGGESAH